MYKAVLAISVIVPIIIGLHFLLKKIKSMLGLGIGIEHQHDTRLHVGMDHQGGVIFYLDGNGGGLIAAPSDQSTVAPWGCEGILIGADRTALETGDQNTADILAGCADTGTSAEICDNLTLGGYSDWYLPSKDELNEMFLNRAAIGGFASNSYRSSTEYNAGTAWTQVFPAGNVYPSSKINAPYTRAIRKIII